MRAHVEAGVEILSATSILCATAPIVRASHEWFNGQGYPSGLAGTAIPLASRIISVADAYDAMTQDRRYRTRLDSVEAVSEAAPGSPDPIRSRRRRRIPEYRQSALGPWPPVPDP